MKPWLRIESAADYADVSKSTVRRWLRAGLPFYKPGSVILIRQSELDEFISSQCASRDVDAIVDDALKGLGR